MLLSGATFDTVIRLAHLYLSAKLKLASQIHTFFRLELLSREKTAKHEAYMLVALHNRLVYYYE
jgi:hypothetical protein